MGNKGKTIKRTAAKADAKKPTSKSAERFDIQQFENIIVSQAELASFFGISASATVQLYRQGVLHRVEGTCDYNLKENVRLYVAHCKSKHAGAAGKAELDMALTKQRIENLKLKNRDYCISLGAEMASGILHGLADAMSKLKETLGKHPDAKKAIDKMISSISKLDAENIAKRETMTAEDVEEKDEE